MSSETVQDFGSKYTNANLAQDAAAYDSATLRGLVEQLEVVDNGSISSVAPAVIAAMLSAQRRGDAVPKLFEDLAEGKTSAEIRDLFLLMRHAVNLTWSFVGLPNCMPAAFGLTNEVRKRDITIDNSLDRPLFGETDWSEIGKQTIAEIYRLVGNAEVASMVADYFPELSYVAQAAVFGFLIGGSGKVQSLPLSEVILAGAIAAMGATRQARSHCKATLGLGLSKEVVKAVVEVAKQVAAWNGTKLPRDIDVEALADEVRENAKKLEGQKE